MFKITDHTIMIVAYTWNIVVVLTGNLMVLQYVSGQSLSDVKKLKKELFTDSGYDRKIRPSLNQTSQTEVCIVLKTTCFFLILFFF